MILIESIIERLKGLDLSEIPKNEIDSMFSEIGNQGYIRVTYHPGKTLMRARPNWESEERFKLKSDLSYKPQRFNQTYQRASTPQKTMFYGTSIPDKIEPGELDNARLIGVLETIPMLRDKTKSGYQKISFGRWIVKEDLDLVSIIHEERYYEESSYTRELVDAFNKTKDLVPAELFERSLKFQSFLASEFSKEDISEHYEYMISAMFSGLVSKAFDGIIYPSVRAAGRGFNVAIRPESVKKMDLVVAGECSVYKHKDRIFVDNDAIVELTGNEEEFEMTDIPNKRDEILEILGFSSIEELIKLNDV